MQAVTLEVAARPGKYLTFGLADELYGLEILRVQEIIGLLPITRVPRMPALVAGVVNLRGRVIPVLDLRLAFGLAGSDREERTCIIVVRTHGTDGEQLTMGVLVDTVSDVADLGENDIEPSPDFGTAIDTAFIKGIGRAAGRIILLLDIERVLSKEQLSAAAALDREDDGAMRASTEGDD